MMERLQNPGGAAIRLTLMTRRDCHLCEEMAAVVREVGEGVPVRLEVRDVDTDEETARRFGHEVPVLLVNGRKAFKYRLTAAQLRRRLGAERRRNRLRRWFGREVR